MHALALTSPIEHLPKKSVYLPFLLESYVGELKYTNSRVYAKNRCERQLDLCFNFFSYASYQKCYNLLTVSFTCSFLKGGININFTWLLRETNVMTSENVWYREKVQEILIFCTSSSFRMQVVWSLPSTVRKKWSSSKPCPHYWIFSLFISEKRKGFQCPAEKPSYLSSPPPAHPHHLLSSLLFWIYMSYALSFWFIYTHFSWILVTTHIKKIEAMFSNTTQWMQHSISISYRRNFIRRLISVQNDQIIIWMLYP